jgi:hypothetical protein
LPPRLAQQRHQARVLRAQHLHHPAPACAHVGQRLRPVIQRNRKATLVAGSVRSLCSAQATVHAHGAVKQGAHGVRCALHAPWA